MWLTMWFEKVYTISENDTSASNVPVSTYQPPKSDIPVSSNETQTSYVPATTYEPSTSDVPATSDEKGIFMGALIVIPGSVKVLITPVLKFNYPQPTIWRL